MLDPDEAEQLRGLMAAVTTEGSGDFLQDVPGEPVLSKSGTAEVGSEDDIRLDAWMVGVQGDLVVAVLVEGGGYGSEAAGPVLEEFLRAAGS
jgi:cell division protein FtsI/penicillin-binding protein 2